MIRELVQRAIGPRWAPLVVGATLVVGCAAAPEPPPADRVILIVVDTLRADVVGCYGGEAVTPNMDRLAAQGVRFADARSHIPITGPSHASMFTSLWPAEHGVRNNTQILDASHQTLAERLQARGFRTAAFVSLGVLKAKFGLDQGFAHYDDGFGANWFHDAAEMNRRVFDWLETTAPERGLLWVHYSDPHEPYSAPDRDYPRVRVLVQGREIGELVANGRKQELLVPLARGRASLRFEAGTTGFDEGELLTLVGGRLSAPGSMKHGRGLFPWFENQTRHDYVTALPAHLEVEAEDRDAEAVTLRFGVSLKLPPGAVRGAYVREVEFVDRMLGELLERLEAAGWLDNALIVVCSDHGEGLGDHGLEGHIHQLYDSLLEVPLILWQPGVLPAAVVERSPVALVDLFPTILRRTGLEVPAGIRGRDLLAERAAAPLLAQTYRPEARRNLAALVDDGHKLIVDRDSGAAELYDLDDDPRERVDRSELNDRLCRSMQEQLEETLAGLDERHAEAAELDEEAREQLRALGYVH